MEIKIFCSSCKANMTTFEHPNLLGQVKSQTCQNCKIVLQTYSIDHSDSRTTDFIELPKQSLYFHLNNLLLHNYIDSKHDYKSYATKNVLIVGCGGIQKEKLIKSLKRFSFNHFVCLCETKSWAYDYFDDWIYADHENGANKEHTLKAVQNYMYLKKLNFDAIFTYDDYCVTITSYLTTCLNLPGIPFETIQKTVNKHEFRKTCASFQINCPKFFSIDSFKRSLYLNDFENFIDATENKVTSPNKEIWCPLPCIIKNINGSGKGKVNFIKSNQQSKKI